MFMKAPPFRAIFSAQALLEFYGALTLLSESVVRSRAAELLDRVGLADRSHEPISCFSKGMVQRLALAQALLNDPELLVLDEPSEGLDLAGRRLVRDVIVERRQRGFTVLLVSHVIGDVEQLCDRVGVLVEGHLVYSGDRGRPGAQTPKAENQARSKQLWIDFTSRRVLPRPPRTKSVWYRGPTHEFPGNHLCVALADP